jgi:hypothetical protein
LSEQSGTGSAGSPYPAQSLYPYGYLPAAPRRRRRGPWLGVTGAVVVVIVAMLSGCAGSTRPAAPKPPGATGAPKPPSATGASACVLPGIQASGSGPWKLVVPSTLCGEPNAWSA